MPEKPLKVWTEINSFFLSCVFYLEYLIIETGQLVNMVGEVNASLPVFKSSCKGLYHVTNRLQQEKP